MTTIQHSAEQSAGRVITFTVTCPAWCGTEHKLEDETYFHGRTFGEVAISGTPFEEATYVVAVTRDDDDGRSMLNVCGERMDLANAERLLAYVTAAVELLRDEAGR